MTQRKLKYEKIETLRCYRSWFLRVCELGLFADGDSHYLHVKKMIQHGTTDGKPWVEPELREEVAIHRPLLMAKQQQSFEWSGPFVLIDKLANGLFVTRFDDQKSVNLWPIARRATPEEIEAANAERG
jgi:hypothetical protein